MTASFHWRLAEGGENLQRAMRGLRDDPAKALPDLQAQIHFCREAERVGIDALLVDINYAKPDPMVLALALAPHTRRLRFMVAHRPGLMSPTLFVQQVNSFSALAQGRICLNMVVGHSPDEQAYYGDFLDHDPRYARMEEFLEICRCLWETAEPVNYSGRYLQVEDARLNTPFTSPKDRKPQIFLSGNSKQAQQAAVSYADCWLRFGDHPQRLIPTIETVLKSGTAVGLRLAVIARPTRAEALDAAALLIDPNRVGEKSEHEHQFVSGSDSVSVQQVYNMATDEWLTPALWTGAVRTYGPPNVALLGTPDEIAQQIIDFESIGISHFILSGWPKLAEMVYFGQEVLPRVRRLEKKLDPAIPRETSHA